MRAKKPAPRAKPVASITYRDAGVDIVAGDALVDRIGPLAKSTMRPEVMAGVGGFSAMCRIPAGYKEPVLVSSTDGVGTKLKLAFMTGRHDTIGIDLVGMVVNDLVTCGAEPLFLLDYFATGALSVEQGEAVVRGIAAGCKLAGCALVGGETAEMPGFYPKGEYDVAGFGVGIVERAKILDGKKARAGDALVAIASSGLHSNGYSLVRRALLGKTEKSAQKALATWVPAFSAPMGEVLMTPTRIYAKLALALTRAPGIDVKGIAHITGGGIEGNLPRVFPETLSARVDTKTWETPPVFELVSIAGNVPRDEMFRTFNMGVGLVVIVDKKSTGAVIAEASRHGDRAWVCGELVARRAGDPDCVLE
jgi:phosphoribosylformylglycinamidine cyclo-ligase